MIRRQKTAATCHGVVIRSAGGGTGLSSLCVLGREAVNGSGTLARDVNVVVACLLDVGAQRRRGQPSIKL